MRTLVAEDANPDIPGPGIEEAEMYVGFAAEIASRLYEDAEACDIAAVEALLDKSRQIMRRLLEEERAGKLKPAA